MIDSHPSVQINQHQDVNQRRSGASVWALFVRAIPLISCFLLFVLAASADVQRWGSRGVLAMLVSATLLGVLGIALFIPKRDFSK